MLLVSSALAAAPVPLPLFGDAHGPVSLREGVAVEVTLAPEVGVCGPLSVHALVDGSGTVSARLADLAVTFRDGRVTVALQEGATLPPGPYDLLLGPAPRSDATVAAGAGATPVDPAAGTDAAKGAGAAEGVACADVYLLDVTVPAAKVRAPEAALTLTRVAPVLPNLPGSTWLQCSEERYPQCTEAAVRVPLVETGGERGANAVSVVPAAKRWGDSGVSTPYPIKEPTVEVRGASASGEEARPEASVIPRNALADVVVKPPDDMPVGTSIIEIDVSSPAMEAPIRVPVTVRVRRAYWVLIVLTFVGAMLQLVNKLFVPWLRDAQLLGKYLAAVRRFVQGERTRADAGLQRTLADALDRLPDGAPLRSWEAAVERTMEVDRTLRRDLADWNDRRARLAADVTSLTASVGALGLMPPTIQAGLDDVERSCSAARAALEGDDLKAADDALGGARAAFERSAREAEVILTELAERLPRLGTAVLPLPNPWSTPGLVELRTAAGMLPNLPPGAAPADVLSLYHRVRGPAKGALEALLVAVESAEVALDVHFGKAEAASPRTTASPRDELLDALDRVSDRAKALFQRAQARLDHEIARLSESEITRLRQKLNQGEYLEMLGQEPPPLRPDVTRGIPESFMSTSEPPPVPVRLTRAVDIDRLPAPPTLPARNLGVSLVESGVGTLVLCFVSYVSYADKFVGTPTECLGVLAFAYAANLGLDSLLAARVKAKPENGGAENGGAAGA